MGDLFWNKIFGAVLATVLVMFGIKELGHALIHPHEPEVPGYKIAVADEGGADKKDVEVAEAPSLAQLLSEASASSGERVSKKCAACHSFEKGGPNKIGPNLWGVLGSPSANHAGFSYSDAMKSFGKTWDYETLSTFLAKPKAAVPGTAMGFAGLKKPKDIANLLAYLRTLSDAPLPLPAVAQKAADVAEAVTNMAEAGVDALTDATTHVQEQVNEAAEAQQPE